MCQSDIECSFVLYFSNDKWFLNNFSCVYRHSHIFSRKKTRPFKSFAQAGVVWSSLFHSHRVWNTFMGRGQNHSLYVVCDFYRTASSRGIRKDRRRWSDGPVCGVFAEYMLNRLSPVPGTCGKARLGSASLLISAPAGGRTPLITYAQAHTPHTHILTLIQYLCLPT